jgi:threonine synthase
MARIIALYGGSMDEKGNIIKEPDIQRMHKEIYAVSISDKQTVNTLRDVYNKFGALTEPHGAAGWAGLMEYFKNHPADARPDQIAVSLETAHPAKFPEEIRKFLGVEPELPASMEGLDKLEESFDNLENNYTKFKDYLISQY